MTRHTSSVKNFFKFFFGFWGLIILSLVIVGLATLYEYTLDDRHTVEASPATADE